MPRTKSYTLKTPVTDGKDEVTELTLKYKLNYTHGQSLTVGSTGDGGSMKVDPKSIITVAAKMIGKVPEFLDELEPEDQGYILGEARDFLLSSLGTGDQE